MNPQTPSDQDVPVAFCQNCGKPLTADERRVVAQAVFCEPCLAERLAAASPPAGSYQYPGSTTGYPAPAPATSAPNPGLAALLGFIPGVGAMYNGQYAKGVVHLIVFTILVSLSSQHGLFGLFVGGWVLYQVFEAHETARARRDGTPLPNPFGLNDLGERLGFGKSWPTASAYAPPAASGVPPVPPVTPPAGTEAPRNPYGWGGQAWQQPTGWQAGTATGNPFSAPPYGAGPIPPNAAYAPVPPAYEPPPATGDRFPTGAIWLIGLGVLFLIGNAGIFHHFPVHRLIPFLLIGFGVWLFVHRMMGTGVGFADDGSPNYRRRLFGALRGSVWVVLTGVLFFLDTAHILSWGRSWPLWIIAAGVMTFLQRSLPPPPPAWMPGRPPYPYQAQAAPPSAAPGAPEGPGSGAAVAPVTPMVPAASISPMAPDGPSDAVVPHDEEGRQI